MRPRSLIAAIGVVGAVTVASSCAGSPSAKASLRAIKAERAAIADGTIADGAIADHAISAVPGATAGGTADTTGIVVHGLGRVTGTPDAIDVTLGVETRNLVAGAALGENATTATALIAVLRKQGVVIADIQTSQLTISPEYGTDGRRITGYVVSNVVTARLRKVDSAGGVIDAAVAGAGDALRVQGIQFSITDPGPLMAKARALAVKDARQQASELADAAGVRVGALRSIRGSSASANPPPTVFATRAQLSAASPVLAGSQEVTAEVDLVYDIA